MACNIFEAGEHRYSPLSFVNEIFAKGIRASRAFLKNTTNEISQYQCHFTVQKICQQKSKGRSRANGNIVEQHVQRTVVGSWRGYSRKGVSWGLSRRADARPVTVNFRFCIRETGPQSLWAQLPPGLRNITIFRSIIVDRRVGEHYYQGRGRGCEKRLTLKSRREEIVLSPLMPVIASYQDCNVTAASRDSSYGLGLII